MNRLFKLFPLLAMLIWTVSSPVLAKSKGGVNANQRTRLSGASQLSMSNRTLVNVSQVAMWIYSDNTSSVDPTGSSSGLYFPRATAPVAAAIFQDGPIWGGLVNDGAEPALRVGGGTWATGTVAGAILAPGVAEDFSDQVNVDRIWRIRRDFLDADLRQDAAEFFNVPDKAGTITDAQIQQVRDIYRQDWVDWPTHKGAPFYDADSNGVYEPEFNADGTPKIFPEADEPGIAGADQVIWLVANDLDNSTVQSLYKSPPIGLEVQTTLWAYSRSDPLGRIIFKQFRLIYKGTQTTPPNATIDSMYVCQWSDPDVGNAGDDFVGSDTTLSLGYAYNSSSNDLTYSQAGLPPPASGYDFFAGPIVAKPGAEAIFNLQRRAGFENLGMSTFGFFAAGGQDDDPDFNVRNGTLQWWNLLRGFRPRPENPPSPWIDPTTSQVTKFTLPGDPVEGTGWIDTNPGDRRMLMVSGPFTMAFGDTQDIVVAALAGLGSDRISSVSVLKFTDRFAQEAFDNLFELPNAPPKPALTATEFDGEILLNWGDNPGAASLTEETVDKGYAFEGYNVYQLPTAGATPAQGVKLATFDAVNEVTVISQEVFDESSGLVLNLPVQQGSNSGLQRSFTISEDLIRELNLVNGQTYFFGVTAYNFNGGQTVKTLESVPSVVTVVPQANKPGERYQAALGDTLGDASSAFNVVHEGPSDGNVIVLVTDPSKITGQDYAVVFSQEPVLDGDGEVVAIQDFWHLVNATTGDTLLTNQTNQSGDNDYLNAEGLQVKVFGAPSDFARTDGGSPAFIEIANEHGPLTENVQDSEGAPFGGNLVWHSSNSGSSSFDGDPNQSADSYFLSTTTSGESGMRTTFSELVPFDWELRFTDDSSNFGWWGFSTENTAPVPFEIWNIGSGTPDDPSDDIRLIPVMFESAGTPDAYTADHGAEGAFGVPAFDRIYWYYPAGDFTYDDFAADAADGTLDQDYTNDLEREVIARLLVADNDGDGAPPEPGTIIRIVSTKPNTPSDRFTFSTSGMQPTASQAQAREDVLSLVNVFPNPYLGFNDFEPTRFNRFVTFSHLPEQATVRIFNLAGIQVRRLEKNDASQFLAWDLQNEEGLPVASGIYVARIEMPGLGAKNLKLALVQEQQFLRAF